MMAGLRLVAAPRALPLRGGDAARLLPWVLALMVYVAGLGGVGLVALEEARRASAAAFAAPLTLEVPAGTSDARMETLLALLRQTAGIQAVRLVNPADTARLLEPWLGRGVKLDDLPIPRLIDLTADPVRKIDFAALRGHLASIVPNARLEDHRTLPATVRDAARPISAVLAAAIAVSLLLVAGAAAAGTGGAMAANRETIELAHLMGAGDGDIACRFAGRAAWRSLAGAAIGGAAIALTVHALAGAGAVLQPPAPLAGGGIGDWRVWAAIAATGVAAVFLATASAWTTARRRLARLP